MKNQIIVLHERLGETAPMISDRQFLVLSAIFQ
jgi:hypothetical protein